MSMIGGRFARGVDEVGHTVASFSAYEPAQKAVSRLIAADIPARDIAIVGQGLRSIERITGRLGYAAAARSGAINGVLLGLLFSAILVIGTPSVPIQAFVGVLFVGIALGMLLSIITYSVMRRRRDYASVTAVVADHYEVTVAAGSIHRARQVIGSSGSEPEPEPHPAPPAETPVDPPVAPRPPADDAAEPPRYGERLPPTTVEGGVPDPGAIPEGEPGGVDGGGIVGAPPGVALPPSDR